MLESAYAADGDTGSASMYSGGAIKTPRGYVDTALAHELVPLQSVIAWIRIQSALMPVAMTWPRRRRGDNGADALPLPPRSVQLSLLLDSKNTNESISLAKC
jgi:hypothetical protein